MPSSKSAVLAALLVELHQRVDVGRRRRTAEGRGRQVGDDAARARRFLGGGRRPADEDLAAARRVLRRHGVERALDADRADVREERVARRRARLQRRAHEVLVEVEHRREVGLRGTSRRRACRPAVVLNRTRIGCPPRPPKTLRGRPVRRRAVCLAAAAAVACRRAAAALPVEQRRAARRRAGSRAFSQGTEPKPVGDMLSPKIGVTVTVYSPSDGNTCLTSMPPRVPNGSPSM